MIVEYDAASQLRHPRQFVRGSANSLLASWRVGWRMFLRNLRAQHRLAMLSYLWLFIPGLAQVFLWSFLNASNVVNTGPTKIPFVAYVVLGVFIWLAFTDGLNAPLQVLGASGQLISRVRFPVESLVIAGLLEALLNTLVRSVIFLPILIWFEIRPSASILLAPLGLIAPLLVGLSVGLIVAPFGLLYQDVGRLIPVATQFLFIVTPIGYAIPKNGMAANLDRFNPLSSLVNTGRSWLTGGPAWPGWTYIAIVSGFGLLLLAGWTLFRLSIPHLVDRVSQ